MNKPRQLITITLISLWLLASLIWAAPPPNTSLHWRQSNTNLPNRDVESLLTHPLSANLVYAGTWGAGVWRSEDYGQTWLTTTLGLNTSFYLQGGLAAAYIPPNLGTGSLGTGQFDLLPAGGTVIYAADYFGAGSP